MNSLLPSNRISYPFWIIGDLNTRWGTDTGDAIRDNSRISTVQEHLLYHQISPLNLSILSHLPGSTHSGTLSFPDSILTNPLGCESTTDLILDNPEWVIPLNSDHHLIGFSIHTYTNGSGRQQIQNPARTRWGPNFKLLKSIYRHHHSLHDNIPCNYCTRKNQIISDLESLKNRLDPAWDNIKIDAMYIILKRAWHSIVSRRCGLIRSNPRKEPMDNTIDWNSIPISHMSSRISRALNPPQQVPSEILPLITQQWQSSSSPRDLPAEDWADEYTSRDLTPETHTLNQRDILMAIHKAPITPGLNQEAIPIELFKLDLINNSYLLSRLFNACLIQRETPKLWRQGKMTPVYKGKGSRTDVNSYRPITLIATTRKLFEIAIISQPFMKHDLNPIQGGFQHRQGCLEQIALLHNFLKSYPSDRREDLCIIQLDIKGAYDNVHRRTLINILQSHCIWPNLADTLSSLLKDTWVDVFANGSSHSSFPTFNGTQQGGPASPILFNYYLDPVTKLLPMINKVQDLCHPRVMILLFADDILYAGPEEFRESVLNAFLEFSARANLLFSPHKCIYQGAREAPTIYGTPILKRSSTSYLGTLISRHGVPESWQTSLLARSHTLISRLTNLVPMQSISIFRRTCIFKTFIRSCSEYLVQLGSLLGNHGFGFLKLFRQSLRDILLLPQKCLSPLLVLVLKLENPYRRLTRLQWIWTQKMKGSHLPIHISLLRDSNLVYKELHNPKTLQLDRMIRSLPEEFPLSNDPKPKQLSWRAVKEEAWSDLCQKCPDTFAMMQKIPMTIIRSALTLSSVSTVQDFFHLNSKSARLAWLHSLIPEDYGASSSLSISESRDL